MRGGGTVNADGFGVGWYPPRGESAARHRTATRVTTRPPGRRRPARYRSDRPLWSDAVFAALARVTPAAGGARRGALGDGRHAGHRDGGGPVRRGPLPVQPQRRGPRLALVGGGARGGAAGHRPAHPRRPHRLPRCCGRWCATASARARTRRPRSPTSSLDVDGRGARLAAEPAAHRRHRDLGHRLDARAVGPQGAGAVMVASEPSDASTGWVGVPDRSLVVRRRSPATGAEGPAAGCRPTPRRGAQLRTASSRLLAAARSDT